MRRRVILGLALSLACPAFAQDQEGQGTLNLSAALGTGPALQAGLRWRVFKSQTDPDGTHRLVVESALPHPSLTVQPGDYVIHVAFGLASATKAISLGPEARDTKLILSAGALRIHCVSEGDKAIGPGDVALAVYVPERNNETAKLVYAKALEDQVIGVPEGNYHIASTYIDNRGIGSLGQTHGGIPTNSISAGDVHVDTGKIVDVTLRHHVATLTIKLVTAPGGGALANSTFTVLTPGGDIVRELGGAFPSLVLAEGEYVVVARHDAKTYQATFTRAIGARPRRRGARARRDQLRGRRCRRSSFRSNASLARLMRSQAPSPRPRSRPKSIPSPGSSTFSPNSTSRATWTSAISSARKSM